jgi:hypothetical protein
MNPTYIRVAFYFLAPILGTLPGITVDMEAMTVLLNINTLMVGLTGSAAATGLVFKKWGKK